MIMSEISNKQLKDIIRNAAETANGLRKDLKKNEVDIHLITTLKDNDDEDIQADYCVELYIDGKLLYSKKQPISDMQWFEKNDDMIEHNLLILLLTDLLTEHFAVLTK